MAHVFNADELMTALEQPVLILNGVEFKAKHLSFKDAIAFQTRLQSLDVTNPDALVTFTEDLCNAIDIPAEVVLGLPPTVFGKVIESFFGYLLGTQTE